jgi:hypothetical protein
MNALSSASFNFIPVSQRPRDLSAALEEPLLKHDMSLLSSSQFQHVFLCLPIPLPIATRISRKNAT